MFIVTQNAAMPQNVRRAVMRHGRFTVCPARNFLGFTVGLADCNDVRLTPCFRAMLASVSPDITTCVRVCVVRIAIDRLPVVVARGVVVTAVDTSSGVRLPLAGGGVELFCGGGLFLAAACKVAA